MNKSRLVLILFLAINFLNIGHIAAQSPYQDKPFLQEYSVKYYLDAPNVSLEKVRTDRNSVVKILSSARLMQPHGGEFLDPGEIVPDGRYRFMKDKKLSDLDLYENQFVFLSDKAVLSDAWAGSLYDDHGLPDANTFGVGNDFSSLVSNGKALKFLVENRMVWQEKVSRCSRHKIPAAEDAVLDFDQRPACTLSYACLPGIDQSIGRRKLHGFRPYRSGQSYSRNDGGLSGMEYGGKKKRLSKPNSPPPTLRRSKVIGDKTWFGTSQGAFAVDQAKATLTTITASAGCRAMQMVDIAEGPEHSVLILTKTGLGELKFKSMTLHDKAVFYDRQVRSRHIRNGFNASQVGMDKGNLSTGYLQDSDNDGLWTSMYLAGEIFRYKVTKEPEALQNCRESLDAMERLYTINPVAGFPARSFERRGYIDQLALTRIAGSIPTIPSGTGRPPRAAMKSSVIFLPSVPWQNCWTIPKMKQRAVALIDTLMGHIVEHDLYLIDYDGKPTQWGKWNPAYVNAFPTNIGDRKLNSSNITAMLQTAYHFTKKEKYKEKALELLQKEGYLENLMRPMSVIGRATDEAGALAQNLSDGWNHSDDEMYFVGYWGLYRYAFNDTLRARYKQAILDHWQAERPEKEGAWNIFTALTGTPNFDLPEAVWYLKEYPLDLIDWAIKNSHRQDIKLIDPNFRGQTTAEVLPPDERPIRRHNANTFQLDSNGKGSSENSAGDIWLLPYWMGRWLGVIGAPVK